MIDFEWTVKFGDILTVAGAAFVGFGLVYRRGANEKGASIRLHILTSEVGDMKKELKGLAQVITALAVQDTKITSLGKQFIMLQQTVEDLRRGSGWVKSRPGIDGEY